MFSERDIMELWQAGGDFREIASTEIVRNFSNQAFVFFHLIQQSHEPLCAIAKNLMPFLRKGYGKPILQKQDYILFQDMNVQYRLFFQRLNEYITSHKQEKQILINLLFFLFDGIAEELKEKYGVIDNDDDDKSAYRQLMLFVTGHCNLHCSYCFSANIEHCQIERESLQQIFGWAKQQGVKSITPCGGEPLMYQHFQIFLDLIEYYEMTTYFATNFTIDISSLNHFTQHTIKGLYVHLTTEVFRNERLMKILVNNIHIAKDRGIELVGRSNITHDLNDIDQWLSFLHDMGLKRLHVALTIPSSFSTNEYISPTEFAAYIPFITDLMVKASNQQIAIGFAKPIPICLFPKETANLLMRMGFDIMNCDIYKDNYMHNVCISPSLDFTPCLGLTSPMIHFSPTLTWDAIEKKYTQHVSALLNTPTYDKCKSCFLWDRRLCQGVCLSYKEKK